MVYQTFTLLPFMVCLFWTILFVLEWRNSYPAKHVLTAFFAVCTGLYFCHAVFFNYNETSIPIANTAYAFCHLAVYPLYHLYICRLTNAHSLTPWRFTILLPAVLVCIWAGVAYAYCPPEGMAQQIRLEATRVLFVLQVLMVCIMGLRQLSRFEKRLENFYSNTEVRTVKATRWMIVILVFCSFASALANHIGREYFKENQIFLPLISLKFAILLFAVAYVGMKQKFCVDDLEAEMAADEEGESLPNTPLSAEEETEQVKAVNEELIEKLEHLMQEEQLYRQTDLRLSELAKSLGVSRNTLSSSINLKLGVSFTDYVNNYRVKHAQSLMLANMTESAFSQLHIAEQSGFTSEVSFYRTFRKFTGKTPKQWLKESVQSLI